MINFMSVLSRYYFAFLIICFIVISISNIYKLFKYNIEPKKCTNLVVINILFLIFAIVILGFYDNMLQFNAQSLIFGLYSIIFSILAPFVIFKAYEKASRIITHSVIFLMSFGFIMLWRLNPSLSTQQLIFASIALLISCLIPFIMKIFKRYDKLEYLYIFICIFLIGISTVSYILGDILGDSWPFVPVTEFGAQNWLEVFGIRFQPSEFAKPFFVLYLASAFKEKPKLSKIIKTGIFTASLIFIFVYQTNLGSSLMFFVVYMAMLYISTGSKILVISGFGMATAASIISYNLFAHVRVRVLAWQDPFSHILTEGWQIAQSMFAMATFGPFGAGLGRGLPRAIPVVERDFIYSAFIEEFGWIFGIMIIIIYSIIFIYGIYIAMNQKRQVDALLASGFSIFIAFQAFVSISGNIKLIPMTGITLPFISYGGSSIFVSIIMIGMLNWLNTKLDNEEEM